MKEMAYAYTPAATEKELAQYRKELALDVERRNHNMHPRDIEPLPGIALPS